MTIFRETILKCIITRDNYSIITTKRGTRFGKKRNNHRFGSPQFYSHVNNEILLKHSLPLKYSRPTPSCHICSYSRSKCSKYDNKFLEYINFGFNKNFWECSQKFFT